MHLKKKDWKMRSYELGDGFIVDTVDDGRVIDVYLYYHYWGIKDLIFSIEKIYVPTEKMLKDYIIESVEILGYRKDYIANYC